MILFFDTETTGLPDDYNAPMSNLNNWPRLVQLAYLQYNFEGELINSGNYIIKPDGFEIPIESTSIHNITNKTALEKGVDLRTVLNDFSKRIEMSSFLVGHNINFDVMVVGTEFLRLKMGTPFKEKKTICTMQKATNFCAIEGNYGFKWPKLSELYSTLFFEDINDSHDAFEDIKNTAKCFWKLYEMGVINLREEWSSKQKESIEMHKMWLKNQIKESYKLKETVDIYFDLTRFELDNYENLNLHMPDTEVFLTNGECWFQINDKYEQPFAITSNQEVNLLKVLRHMLSGNSIVPPNIVFEGAKIKVSIISA